MSRDLELTLHLARRIARTAATRIAELYVACQAGAAAGTLFKGEDGPVTAADQAANQIILRELGAAFPGDALLSEENPESWVTTGEWTWMIDPLDGTEEFLKQNGEFMVMIGLAHHGVPVLGVVIEPATLDEYFALRGHGAWRLAPSATEPERLHVSTRSDPAAMTLAVSRSHRSPRVESFCQQLQLTRELRSGSVGRKVALVTTGRADVYLHPSPGTKLWDTCAPQIIHQEAGGVFTTALGAPIRYVRPDGDVRNDEGLLAAGPAAFEVLLAAARRAWEVPLPPRLPKKP